MRGLLYGIAIQWKIDIRNRSMLITAYIVPLAFFALMGGIFTSLMPETTNTIIASMSIMGISMGSLAGMPPSIVEIYSSNIKKMYIANGIPIYYGLLTFVISTFIHLMIMSVLIFLIAPIAFDAKIPTNIPLYFMNLAFFTIVSLSVACLLGLVVKNQTKLTMISQLVFLPSIMLSGIMFSTDLLPSFLALIGQVFPATWGYQLLCEVNVTISNYLPLVCILLLMILACFVQLKRIQAE